VEAWERAVAAHRAFWAAAGRVFPRETGRYGGPDVAPLAPAGALLSEALDGLAAAVGQVAPHLPDEDASRARSVGNDVRRLAGLVGHLLRPDAEETVFWYVREGRELTLTATPVDVGETLSAGLWPNVVGGILTSATLSVGDDGAALARELGLDPAVGFATWPSPFSYDGVEAFVLRYLPHPDDPLCPEAVAATLRQVLGVPRRALALFTSRRSLESTAAHLTGAPHLVQGRDGEREQLLARFRHHPPPVVLLGLHTLWEGIDLPGEELELLIVVRLPFPVPTDPVIEAQTERILGRGGIPFQELFLPRAVLRLRQGVGRLVRTPTDRGAVLLADPRLSTHAYGEAFLNALPVPAQPVDDPDQLGVALSRLFR
jgi:ATP-dependent DNA helicase DinG